MYRIILLSALLLACSEASPTRSLDDLVVRDRTYLVAETMEPYTGGVFRAFPGDSSRLQLEGTMVQGSWHGELRVYHENGRVRYMGRLARGVQCGEWIEDADSDPAPDFYEELVSELQSLSVYPPCPTDG